MANNTMLKRGGRDDDGRLITYAILTDWNDINSWITMNVNPEIMINTFPTITVGRRLALVRLLYVEDANGSDILRKKKTILRFDRGVYPNIRKITVEKVRKKVKQFLLNR